MRRLRIALVTAAAASTLAFGVIVALPASAAELLANPGFETGNLSGWSCEPASNVASGQSHGGSYALLGNPTGSVTARCQQTVTVVPSTAYALTGWVNGAYVFLGVTGGVDASTWTPGTGGAYTRLSGRLHHRREPAYGRGLLHGWYAQGAFRADDLSLSGPGGPPTTPPPTTPPPTTAPPTTPPTTTPPTTPPTGSLPRHVLTGYWQDFVNAAARLRLRDVPNEYDLIAVAFAGTGASPGQITFGVDGQLSAALGGYSNADFGPTSRPCAHGASGSCCPSVARPAR